MTNFIEKISAEKANEIRINLSELFEYKSGRNTHTLLKDYSTGHVFILTYWAGTATAKPDYSLWEADEESAADTIKMYYQELAVNANIAKDVDLKHAA